MQKVERFRAGHFGDEDAVMTRLTGLLKEFSDPGDPGR